MNREDIIRMAREADLWLTSDERIAAVQRFAALVAAAEREEWTKALDAEMVSCHLGVFNAEDDPRVAIAKLLAWHQDVALDPAVSSRAQELILKEREECARVCESQQNMAVMRHPARIEVEQSTQNMMALKCAGLIRSRGNKA
jgi:hypothetical protein